MFNPHKSTAGKSEEKKELRHPPTRVGLAAVSTEIKSFIDLVKGLPLGEQTFSSDISHRREMFRKYLGYIVGDDPRADVQKSVGYGAALEIRMIQELEKILNHSDDDFAEKAELIAELNPSGFNEIKDQFEVALSELTEAIDSDEAEFGDIVGPFNKVHSVIAPLFTVHLQEALDLRKQMEAQANNDLRVLMESI